ncbi:MAG TPA: GspH/FimT family pseudopilin [Longimicrobium sp.]
MRRSGFTLAEVLVVLVVIGIVSAAVAPALARGARPHPVDAAAGEIRDLLAGARRTAVRRGTPVVVELDPRTGRYRVEADAGDGPPAKPIAEGVLQLPEGVAPDAPAGTRRFTFGVLGAGQGADVVMRGGGRTAAVGMDPWTGEVRATAR